MPDDSSEVWYPRQIADLLPLLTGSVPRRGGDASLFGGNAEGLKTTREVVFMTSYSPWKGKFLAREFVAKFRDDSPFLLTFLSAEDEFIRVSAV